MSIHDAKFSKIGFLTLTATLMLTTASSAWARASARPLSGESLTQVVSEVSPPAAPVQLDPSLAMASSGPDPLASFGPSSGTVVGNRTAALRDDVLRLRSSVNLNSNEFAILRTGGAAGAVQYHSTVAAITARLQNGTTKGNPILLRQWEEADASLNEVSSSLNKLNGLQVSINTDASVSSYLLDSIEAAFDLSGAVDEDHDQLKLLRDEVSRLVVQLDYLRNQTAADIQRQSTYLASERSNIQALALAISRGEMLGNSLANRPVIVNRAPLMSRAAAAEAQPDAPRAAPASPVAREEMSDYGYDATMATGAPAVSKRVSPTNAAGVSASGHLLVLIRYNRPNVNYEQQLSQAVGSAIERHPNAEFSIVAVSPVSGDPIEVADKQQSARRNAEGVRRSLVQLGLSPGRITMASTQTQMAQTPEVHVYVR